MPEINTEQTLMENCTLWAISSSGWSGKDKLRPEDIGKTEDEISSIFKLGTKEMLPYEQRVILNRPRTKLTGFLKKMGKPFILRGVRAIPNKNLAMTKVGVDGYIDEMKQNVENFLGEYDNIRKEREMLYPELRNADWPTPEKIRKAFKIKVVVFEIGTTKVNQADPDELIDIKNECVNDYKKSIEELKEVYIKDAQNAIIENCKEISSRIIDGSGKITSATLKKPFKLIDEYEAIASLFDIDEIKEKVEELKDVMNEVTAKELKSSAVVAEDFAYAVKTIGEDIGDLSGLSEDGQAKRIIKMKKAA